MAYNESLADRVREIIAARHSQVEEKRMFGGLCFMVNDKMCVGVRGEGLMVRLNPELHDQILEQEDCEPLDHSGRSMKGFIVVDAEGLRTQSKLLHWVDLALQFNPMAKATKKKK
jgi:TfoX/Sxy family transcriptional regulator of competence genes